MTRQSPEPMLSQQSKTPIAKPTLLDRMLRAYFRSGWRGFIRLWRLSGRDLRDTLRASTSVGTVLELSPFSYIDSIVLREGYYETEVMEALVSSLGKGVLWDIGANIGLHGLSAKHLRPESRVICFEPSVEMLSRLCRNRAINGSDFEIVGLALSNRAGFQTLHLGPPGNPGMTTLSPWSEATYSGSCVVATARGDELVDHQLVPPPTVIKLDVEGHELPVLEGLHSTLRLPSLHSVVFEDSSDPASGIKVLLGAAGFTVERLVRVEHSQHGLENFIARRP